MSLKLFNKVLIIVNQFPPPINGGNIRWLKFVKFLLKNNIDTYVIINSNVKDDIEFNNFKIEQNIELAKFYYQKNLNSNINPINKLKKFKLLTYIKKSFNKYLVPDKYLFTWNKIAIRQAIKIINENSIENIICSAPPFSTLLIGLELKKIYKNKINLISDFRDLWSLSPNFHLNLQKLHFFNKILEKKVLQKSDKVIFVSNSIKNNTLEHFNVKSTIKYNVIENGCDLTNFNKSIYKKNVDKNNKINISYIGSIFGARCNNKLYKGLLDFSISNSPNFYLNFIGEFDNNYINNLKKINSIVNVFHQVNHEEAIDKMINSDGLLLILSNDQEGSMAFTGKFFEYLASKKPIFALVPQGEVSEVINKYNLGICVNPDSASEITLGFHKFLTGISNNSFAIPPEDLLNSFSREEQTKKLINLFV